MDRRISQRQGRSGRAPARDRARRYLALALLLLPVFMGVLPAAAADMPGSAEWAAFKARFISDDGRVIDNANGGVTHTEGQGYALLCSVAFDDRATFDLVWRWTETHLPRRADGLLPWRWTPEGTSGRVTDPNNATDGDLLVAWALARAGARWNDESYRAAASGHARAILGTLVREVGGLPILLPGAVGFERKDWVVLNLSYWVFPAFPALAGVAPSPLWAALTASGLELVRAARFGAWSLPADWTQLARGNGDRRPLAQRLKPAQGFKPTFGYEAIRIPLYLAWGGFTEADYLQPFARVWHHYALPSLVPARLDLETGAPAPYPISRGEQAIVIFALRAAGAPLPAPPELGLLPSDDYYGSALLLLTRLAERDRAAARPR